MSPYIETIRLQNGELKNLPYHQLRFERTRSQELGLASHPELAKEIPIPEGLDQGLLKCRIIYGETIERIEYEMYIRNEPASLKLVFSNDISYGYKYLNRSELEALYKLRGSCDDILIVKEGCLSDSYYANIAFWDGRDWFTPDTPLLPGTMRAALLDQGLLQVARIVPGDMKNFQKIRLINAMNDLNEGGEIPMDKITM